MDCRVTLLTADQILGDKQLKLIKKLSATATLSDFAILSGALPSRWQGYDSDTFKSAYRGCYWTSSFSGCGKPYTINWNGDIYSGELYMPFFAVRPALVGFFPKNVTRGRSGILKTQYGEYPQQAVDEILSKILENKYQTQKINITGKTYTTNSKEYNVYDDHDFLAQQHLNMNTRERNMFV